MQFRELERKGKCSICSNIINMKVDRVFISTTGKHKKNVIVCNECVVEMYKELKRSVTNGR